MEFKQPVNDRVCDADGTPLERRADDDELTVRRRLALYREQTAPLEAFYAMDVDVAFGTDSLASVADLNMFAELAAARRIAPRVPARALLRSATLTGARALGFGGDLGSIERSKRAALIAVRVPEGVSDVEEYLVSGVDPDAVTWLDTTTPNPRLATPNSG